MRIKKLLANEYDAIILSEADERTGQTNLITEVLNHKFFYLLHVKALLVYKQCKVVILKKYSNL